MTSDVALQFANAVLRRLDVDWDGLGFSDGVMNELAEHLLRIIQSLSSIRAPAAPRRGASRVHAHVG